jgi:arylsulfatase A-like enzyme
MVVRIFAFWTAWFAVARALFLAYEWRQTRTLDLRLLTGLWTHGVPMDLAAAAYLTIVPWLLMVLLGRARPHVIRRALAAYFALTIATAALITVSDLQLFIEWRYRLDGTLIHFLSTPDEALASSASAPWVSLSCILVVLTAVSFLAAYRWLLRPPVALTPIGWGGALIPVALGVTLVVPVPRALPWGQLHAESAPFSANEFANEAALNATWHFAHATLRAMADPTDNPYAVLAPTDARAVVDSLLQPAHARRRSLLRIRRPNVVLIVWESLTAKVVERLGGARGVTPQFDRLTHDGVLFDSIFASAGRTAPGLVALLSGFPAPPHEQILHALHKVTSLPMLSVLLQAAGYGTSFSYGGDLGFANLRAYTDAGRFQRVLSEEAFPSRERSSKWGVPDHVVFGRVLADLAQERRPFFATVATLSSHEPFDVPVPPVFPGADDDTLFLNAHHYTDASLGAFIDAARRQPWWDSTLVIIVADHGSPRPVPPLVADEPAPDRYHIPMLWLGGALAVRDTVIHTVGSQVDLAPTLLAQLGQPADPFRWGKNLLASGNGFAYFAYHDGFGFVDPHGWVIYDELAHRATGSEGYGSARLEREGEAMLQTSFADYLSR